MRTPPFYPLAGDKCGAAASSWQANSGTHARRAYAKPFLSNPASEGGAFPALSRVPMELSALPTLRGAVLIALPLPSKLLLLRHV